MRPLRVADSATIILGLQDEIRRSEESRYDHRLHGVLLVAQGMTCPEVAKLLVPMSQHSSRFWQDIFREVPHDQYPCALGLSLRRAPTFEIWTCLVPATPG